MNSAPGDARRRQSRHAHVLAVILEVAPVLAILLVSSLGLWAFTTYTERRAAIRAAETERYLEQFEHGPVADAWQRLQAEPAASRAAAVPADLASDVDLMLQYFDRLALCLRMGSCDPTLASRRLGDVPWRFLERYSEISSRAEPERHAPDSGSRPLRRAAGRDDVGPSGVRSLPGL
jgi:hypothetical protein